MFLVDQILFLTVFDLLNMPFVKEIVSLYRFSATVLTCKSL